MFFRICFSTFSSHRFSHTFNKLCKQPFQVLGINVDGTPWDVPAKGNSEAAPHKKFSGKGDAKQIETLQFKVKKQRAQILRQKGILPLNH
jgi:hypothetical protein